MEKSNSTFEQHFTGKELKVLEDAELIGIKPVAPSLAASLFNLFLEGYSLGKNSNGMINGSNTLLICRIRFKESS
jgi:hypothetical protein